MQIIKIKTECEDITTNLTENKRIIRENYYQISNKLDNVNEKNKFLKTQKFSMLTQQEKGNHNTAITRKSIIKILQMKKKAHVQIASRVNSTKFSLKELTQILYQTLSRITSNTS